MKVGGVLRLSFPGLVGVLRRHYRSSTFQGARTGQVEAYETWHHKHFYCLENLALAAAHIGFSACQSEAFGSSRFDALKNLETRADQIDLNLIVELVK